MSCLSSLLIKETINAGIIAKTGICLGVNKEVFDKVLFDLGNSSRTQKRVLTTI